MTIRRQPADFVVEERLSPAFEAGLRTDRGPGAAHAAYALTKVSLTTPDAARHLARALRLPAGAVSYAGLKDRHATTTQIMSVRPPPSAPPAPRVEGRGWTALRRGWTDRAVTAEAIDGNRFTIVVRGLSSASAAEMDRRAGLLRDAAGPDEGSLPGALLFVNYFGDQRFGSARHGQGFVARRLIEGDFEGALRLSIGTPARKDSGAKRRFTRVCASAWGRWDDMLRELPPTADRPAVERLAAGADFREAFAALPQFFQLMCVEAYQSHLWNATARGLAERLGPGPERLRTDDPFGPMVFPTAGSVSDAERALVIPLLGPRTELVEPWGHAAAAALGAEGIDVSRLRIPGLRRPFFGEAPRRLFCGADRFVMSRPERDELSSGSARLKRVLSFDLPRGAYATVVLRALGQ